MAASSNDPLAQVPPPAERRLALRVTPAAQRALRQGHPWLYAEAITELKGEGRPGDLAVVFDNYRRFLAIGLYDPTSPLRVRVLHHGAPQAIDRAWLAGKLAAAVDWRASLPESGTTGYRLVHGENDGLPGLVVDRYDTTLVVKLYSAAWIPHLRDVQAALDEVMPARAVVLRLSREVTAHPEYLYGLDDGLVTAGSLSNPVVQFSENGLRFEADVLRGQKTGFFFDQRDNRARVETLAAGRRTLNVFAYTGGFSLYAARGRAPEVVSLDASAPALAAAERNFALNRNVSTIAATHHTVVAADAFETLEDLARHGSRFDLVVVDPPSMAKRAAESKTALRQYARLTEMALSVLARRGILVMASCSSRVSAEQFFEVVTSTAAAVRRPLRELARTGHAIDHPVLFPEGAYLKCLFGETG